MKPPRPALSTTASSFGVEASSFRDRARTESKLVRSTFSGWSEIRDSLSVRPPHDRLRWLFKRPSVSSPFFVLLVVNMTVNDLFSGCVGRNSSISRQQMEKPRPLAFYVSLCSHRGQIEGHRLVYLLAPVTKTKVLSWSPPFPLIMNVYPLDNNIQASESSQSSRRSFEKSMFGVFAPADFYPCHMTTLNPSKVQVSEKSKNKTYIPPCQL